MSYAPTLTPSPSTVTMPGTTVTFTSLAPGCAAVNVYRIARGRQMLLRGGVNLPIAGGVALVDLEAPGVQASYLAEMLDDDGDSMGFTSPATTTLNLTSSYVHNPFAPTVGIACRIAASTGSQVAGQVPISTYYPIGRQAGVAISGPRRGIANVQLAVYGDTIAQSDALDAMFGQLSGELGLPPFVCVRFSSIIAARIRLPQPLFLAVPAPTQTPVNLLAGGTRIGWDLSGAEVDPPAAALAQPLLRRADMNAFYATRAAFRTAYATRFAANTDYNLAGYAG